MINNSNNSIEEGLVAITGVGFRIPSGNTKKSIQTPSELWDNLINGFDAVIEPKERWSENFHKLGVFNNYNAGVLPLDELKQFDPLFFGINPTEASTIDPQQRLLLKCTWEALEDSKIDPISIRNSNTSVFIGCSTNDYLHINSNKNEVFPNLFGLTNHSVSNRISYYFSFSGSSLTVDTACSSSSNAILLGYESIKNKNSTVSIVGGVNVLLETGITKSFSYLNILSKVAGRCMTFDEEADGFVRGECVAVLVLKDLKQAIKDGNNIYCIINGGSSNVDGNGLKDKQNFYSPSSISQADNIKLALLSTNGTVKASDIKYCEAHGTGTPTGDPVECRGISMALNTGEDSVRSGNPLLIGSIKSNIGHCEAGSGAASLIKCCLMYRYRQFVPNINFNTPNPQIKFDEWNLKVVTEVTPFSNDDSEDCSNTSIIVNNFGVTGSNVCLVLSEYNNNKTNSLNNQNILIPFSANSYDSLNQYQESIIDNKDFQSKVQFNQFAQLQLLYKSTSLYQRSVIVAKDWNSFNGGNNQIKYQTSNKKLSNILNSNRSNPITVFVFCGQGAHYSSMALELYNNEEVFKYWVDLLDREFLKYYGYSVLEKLRKTKDQDNLSMHDQTLAQPSTVMLQVSLFELYKHWGVNPSFIIGHSLGEITSAYCSGMIDLDTLCYLVYHRSLAQTKTNGAGKMLSINISAYEFKERYSSKYPNIQIACYNSPTSIVIAGKECDLIEISNDLKENKEFSAMLGTLSSFHTNSQLIIKDEILNLNIQSKSPNIPIFSTVTSKLFNSNSHNDSNDNEPTAVTFNSGYVFDNIHKPVLFSDTISNLYQHIESNQLGNHIVFVEIAPHPTLSYYLKQMVPNQSKYFNNGESISIYSTLHKKKNDIAEFQQTISQLYCQNGYNINFKSQLKQHEQQSKSLLPLLNILPNYKWDDQSYWKEDPSIKNHSINGPPINILGTSNKDAVSLNKSYQTFIDIQRVPFQYLKGHQVMNKYLFPGFGYVDNLLKLYPSQDILISSLEFKTPLVLTEGNNICLQTNLTQTGKNEFNAMFHFKNQKSNEWVPSANGCIQSFNQIVFTNVDKEKINIQELISTKYNLVKVSKDELYPHIKSKTGLSYSGVFQGSSECYLGDNCSLSVIPLDSSSSSFFSTQILDSSLHGILALVKDNCQLVFQSIEGFKYYSSNVPSTTENHANIYAFSKMLSTTSSSLTASLLVTLYDGTVLIEIDKVVCASLIPIKDSTNIEYSNDLIYSYHLQPIDSVVPSPSSFNHLLQLEPAKHTNTSDYHLYLSSYLYLYINERYPNITLDEIQNNSIDQLYTKYNQSSKSSLKSAIVYSRLFKSTFEIIKQYGYSQNYKTIRKQMIDTVHKILKKSSRIKAKLLLPLDNEDPDVDTQHSIFEDDLIDKFYNIPGMSELNNVIGQIIQESIKPFIGEKIEIKILEFGGGTCSLSRHVLNKINSLIEENPTVFEIDIEYTWTDISSAFIHDAKGHFSHINKKINIIYKTLDLDEALADSKKVKSSYYDFIIMSGVLHVVKNLSFSVGQLYKMLSPNGHLLFIEPHNKSVVIKAIFSIFDQWWTFEDTNLRSESCLLSQESWHSLLSSLNFKDTVITHITNYHSMLIHTRKPFAIEQYQNDNNSLASLYDQVIIFKNNGHGISKRLIKTIKANNRSSKIIKLSTIEQFNEIKDSITDNSIIYFIKTIDQLNLDNFKIISLENVRINQALLERNSKCKIVLVTCDSDSTNYLASSVVGAQRYFIEFPVIQKTILNFDSVSIENQEILSSIESLISPNKEYIIKDNKIYYERLKKVSNIQNTFQSNAYEDKDYYIKLDTNLQYQLKSKIKTLQPDEVEVKVIASGINYKDYLIYSGVVTGVPNEFGLEFSGIVTKVGCNCENSFKVGDEVYGLSSNSTSSHIIVDQHSICHKPFNISHTQAASIPVVYITSYHSIFKVGSFEIEDNETILIHSGSGGVGLSALEILKWKGHKSAVFLTVGSDEKKQYIVDKYGDFISGIYSTRDMNYSTQIKKRLKELGYENKEGVDLILNTLSSDYMESNFKCLAKGGRIVDLSITHLNANEYINNNKFKFNCGYHNVELQHLNPRNLKKYLNIISRAIQNNQLGLIPTIEYSNSNIKDAIEYINQRKHIGKIVVNMDTDILDQLSLNKISAISTNDENDEIIIKSNYKINQIGKNILVTGQTGSILEVLKWIIKYATPSVENIIVLSKSSLKWELQLLINQNKHINFHFKSLDISDSKSVEHSINEILSDYPNIKNIDSIIHFAAVQVSCEVNEISMEHFDISHAAKTLGAINLHNQSVKRGWKLINFILASSVSSLVKSIKQCSYISSNYVLDSFSKYRKSLGLPCTSINFGVLADGYVNRNLSVGIMLQTQGLETISNNLFLGSLDLAIQNQNLSTNLVVSKFNFKVFFTNSNLPELIFDNIRNRFESKNSGNSSNSNEPNLNIQEIVIDKVSELLSIDSSKINTDLKIIDYGADSLTIVSLKNWADKEFSPNIISMQEIQGHSLDSVIQIIESKSKNIQDKSDSINSNDQNKTSSLALHEPKIKKINWKKQLKEFQDYQLSSTTLSSNINSNNVFLVNLNGYLDIHILFTLLKNQNNHSKVYCAIPKSLIVDQLKQYQLFNHLNQNELTRIISIQDEFSNNKDMIINLSKKQFGLSNQDYLLLSQDIGIIIFNNSNEKNSVFSKQSECDHNEIKTLKEIITFSITSTKKSIINLSSIFVYSGNENNESELPDFNSIELLPNEYLKYKLTTEHILKDASTKYNINTIIIRTPLVFPNINSHLGDEYDNSLLYIQTCVILGCFPNLSNFKFASIPVDFLLNTISNLVCNNDIISNNKNNENNYHNNLFKIQNLYSSDTFLSANQILEKEFNCKPKPLEEYYNLLSLSNHTSCIKYYQANESFYEYSTLEIFNSNNNNGLITSDTTSSYLIDNQMIINYLNNFLNSNK